MPLGTLDRSAPTLFKHGPSPLSRLALYSALALFLMVADARFRITEPLRKVVATALYPLQWLMLQPVELADKGLGYLQSLQAAQQAADAAQKQMAQMSVRAGETDQLLRENAELRQLLALRARLDTPAQAAQVLGVAEAGFFPGILVFLNRWYPARRRAQVTALFAIAVPMAGVLGGPISGAILENFHDVGSLRGWQWMFLIEGAPVVLLGLVVLKWLPDSFESVHWLTAEQKQQLRTQLSNEEQRKTITSFGGILRDPQVWLLVAVYFAVMLAVNTLAFWMPTLIHGAGIGRDSQVGLLSAVPYLAGCFFMLGCGRSSDRHRERRWHLCVPLLMAALGIAVAGLAPANALLVMGGLVVAGMGASAALPMFWQLPPAFLSHTTQAAGIAMISSFGSIAAFLAPYLIGWMRDATQSASLALYVLALFIRSESTRLNSSHT